MIIVYPYAWRRTIDRTIHTTALAPGIDGYRVGFIGCAVLLGAAAVMVLTSIRDR